MSVAGLVLGWCIGVGSGIAVSLVDDLIEDSRERDYHRRMMTFADGLSPDVKARLAELRQASVAPPPRATRSAPDSPLPQRVESGDENAGRLP